MRKPIAIFIVINFIIILITVLYSFAAEERITLTTYYPAPYGIYKEMRVDQMAVGSGYRYSPALTDGTFLVLDKVGINTTNPYSRLEVDGGFVSINPSAATGTGQVIVRGTGNLRSPNNGSAIAFMLPANTDGTDPWDQARILATPDNSNTGNAAGRMYLQTRYYQTGTPDQWLWRNNIVLRSTGRVGIGTTNPLSPLNVYENNDNYVGDAGLTITQAGSGDSKLNFVLSGTNHNWSMGIDNVDDDKFRIVHGQNLRFNNPWVSFFTIGSSGNVGIGNTNPMTKLELGCWGPGALYNVSATLRLTGDIQFNNEGGCIYWGDEPVGPLATGAIHFRQTSVQNNYAWANIIPRMVIGNNGTFSIANKSPLAQNGLGIFSVFGSDSTTGGDGRYIWLQAENGATLNHNGGDIYLLPGGPGGPSGTGRWGRVGIGTANPQAALHVQGNETVSGNLIVGGLFKPTITYKYIEEEGGGDSWVDIAGNWNFCVCMGYRVDDHGGQESSNVEVEIQNSNFPDNGNTYTATGPISGWRYHKRDGDETYYAARILCVRFGS